MEAYNHSLYPFEGKWIFIDGSKIHYIDEGQGDIILFSHPPLASSFMYREFVNILKNNYRCIAIDYPGFGLSEASTHYTMGIETQSQMLEKFIFKLDLNKIWVLGHDIGGPSAFGTAIKYPERFNGLILIDTIIYPVSAYKKLSKMLGFVGSDVFGWFNAKTNFLVKGTYSYGVKTRKLTKEVKTQYQKMFNTSKKRKRITQMLFNLKESEVFMNKIRAGFEGILNQKPTLLIYGENDPVHELGIPDRIHQLMPNSDLYLIDKEGHFPHEGQPKQMSHIIHNWITKISGNENF